MNVVFSSPRMRFYCASTPTSCPALLLAAIIFLLQANVLHSFSAHPPLWDTTHLRKHAANTRHLAMYHPPRRQPLSRLYESQEQSAPSSSSSLEMDDPEFDRLSRIHTVVENLKVQIPTLLSTPLTDTSSKAVYDDYVKLVVDDIELASSREELQSLSSTLVLAVLATNQANSFLANAVSLAMSEDTDNNNNSGLSQSTVKSSMAMDPTSTAVRVQWKVTLPGQQKLQGLSELELNPETGKVTTLRLLRIQFNSERMNARAIGESLSSLRQLVFAFQNSPFLPKSGLPSLSSLLGSDFVQQVSNRQSTASAATTEAAPPLYITENLESAFAAYNNTSTSNGTTSTTLIPIDDYVVAKSTSSLPLPGSQVWNQYVAARRVFATFCEIALPILSGNLSVTSPEMLELFSPHAVLKATDRSELLRGRDPVGNFFHTLASFRKRSSGTWELANATLIKYEDDQATIAVDYVATSLVPGSSSPVVIEGTDYFVVESPILAGSGADSGNEDDVEVFIQQVEQRKLQIKGGAVGNRSTEDALWFMKSLVALDAGRLSSVGADSVVMDLLQRVIAGDTGRPGTSTSNTNGDITGAQKKKRRRIPPKLSETVAARVYTIMSGLYQDVPALFDKEMLGTYQLPPLHEYMSKDVELRGYLGETLVRGLSSYNTALGAIFGSLKGALATGGAKLDQEPTVAVELTAEGHVRVRLSVDLKVLPLPTGAGELLNSMSGSAINLPSGGFPLKFAIVSDYVLDKETGEIYQHKVIETRINDVLTPGDLFSRWIQKQVSQNPQGGVPPNWNDRAAIQRGLMDAISWVRSVSGRI